MNTRIVAIFNRKKSLLGIVLLTALIVVTLLFYKSSRIARDLSVFVDGLSTCMNRVGQSYSARLLNDSSNGIYSNKFFNATESCVADVISFANDNLLEVAESKMLLLNNLATDVHWFHEKVSETVHEERQRVETILGNRYQKILNQHEDIIMSIDEEKAAYTDTISNLKVLFYLLGIIVPFLLLLDYRHSLKEFLKRFDVEEMAEKELAKRGAAVVVNSSASDVIRVALEACNLPVCLELFAKYKTNTEKSKFLDETEEIDDIELHPNGFFVDKVYDDSIAGSKVNDKVRATTDEKHVNVDSVFAKVIDSLTDRLFTSGVIVNMDVDSELEINTEEEVFEQILFQAINYSVKSCVNICGVKSINIEIKKLGETVVLNITDSGVGFSKAWLQQEYGFGSLDADDTSVELLILKELVEDVGHKIFFENVIGDDGKIIGGKTQLLFRYSNSLQIGDSSSNIGSGRKFQKNKMVSLVKGKKRDILAELEHAEF